MKLLSSSHFHFLGASIYSVSLSPLKHKPSLSSLRDQPGEQSRYCIADDAAWCKPPPSPRLAAASGTENSNSCNLYCFQLNFMLNVGNDEFDEECLLLWFYGSHPEARISRPLHFLPEKCKKVNSVLKAILMPSHLRHFDKFYSVSCNHRLLQLNVYISPVLQRLSILKAEK